MLDTPRRGFSVGCESGSEVGVLLRELSVVEQRYQAVLAVVEDRLSVTDVAEKVGVCRQSLHEWLRRYAEEGLAGLADRSHRPRSCPHQMDPAVEVRLVELRQAHPLGADAERIGHSDRWIAPANGTLFALSTSPRCYFARPLGFVVANLLPSLSSGGPRGKSRQTAGLPRVSGSVDYRAGGSRVTVNSSSSTVALLNCGFGTRLRVSDQIGWARLFRSRVMPL